MIRLLKMVAAVAAMVTTVMVPHLVTGGESSWTLLGYAAVMVVAAGTVVQLTASAAVQEIVSARPKPLASAPKSLLTAAEADAWMAKHWPDLPDTTGGEGR